MWHQYAPDPAMKSNLRIRRRLAPLLDNHKGKWLILNSILMSLMGTPIIYYGDEIGMGDNIALPDRHGVRTPMQWDDSPQAGFSTAPATYFPVIESREYGYQTVNVAAQEDNPESYLNATRFLLRVRRAHPELQTGELRFVPRDNPQVLAYWRILGEERTLCVYNLSSDVQSVSLYFEEIHGRGHFIDLLHAGQSWSLTDNVPSVLKMRPWASHWLYWDKR